MLQQVPHDRFTRNGDDLHMKLNIGITEALCGFKLPIQHLANRELLIVNNPGKIVEPGLYLQGYSRILTSSSELQVSSINFSFIHQRPML